MAPQEFTQFDRSLFTIRDLESEKTKLLIMMYREARSKTLTCSNCEKESEVAQVGYVIKAHTEPGPMGGVFVRDDEDSHLIVCPRCKKEALPKESQSWLEIKSALERGLLDPHLVFAGIYWKRPNNSLSRMPGEFWLKHGI